LPQWVADLKAAAFYDEASTTWIEINSEDAIDITNFAVLMGKKGQPLLSAKQLMKAVGWDGTSFESLDNMDLSAVQIQGRVEDNDPEYADKNPYQISWIDAADAVPGRKLQKLEAAEVKSLNAKFANGLRALAGAPKPKSVPAKLSIPGKPTVLAPSVPDEPTPPVKLVPFGRLEGVKAAMRVKNEEKKQRGQEAESKAPKSAKVPVPETKKITMETAWESCCEGRSESITDEMLGNHWNDVIEEAGGEDAVETKGLWAEVREAVVAKCRVEDNIPF